jgi:plastocyanin
MWPVLWVAAGCGGGAPETPPPQEAARAAAPATGAGSEAGRGSIAGRVVLAGPRPQPAPVQVTKDVEVCGVHPIVDESLVVGAGGGIRDVVLSLAGAPSEPLPAAELRQKGCVFIPHVTLVPAGAPLKIYNDDGVLHNLHTFSTLNPAFNKAQPKYMKVMEATFERPETIKVACDAHPWMAAWLVVTEHRFVAVTDAEGAFRIDSVPAGSYAARVWHETLGERAVTVEVRAGQPSDLSLEFSR